MINVQCLRSRTSVFVWPSPSVRLGLKATSLSRFLQTLCFVLKHRGTALSVNKQAERFSLLPQPLSCAEVLAPLLCWASLSGDKALTNQIHCLSEKSKTKEMLGECRLEWKTTINNKFSIEFPDLWIFLIQTSSSIMEPPQCYTVLYRTVVKSGYF